MAAMMAAAPFDPHLYSDDPTGDTHSLMEASIEDFEDQERRSPLFPGFKSEHEESEVDDKSSTGMPWSPPGFRYQNASVSGWYRQDPYGKYQLRPSASPSRSRQTSPEIYLDANEGDPDITIAVNTPLPTGFDSPQRERSPEVDPPLFEGNTWGQPDPSEEAHNNCKGFLRGCGTVW